MQRMAYPTKGRRSMQKHSSSHCQPLELRFLAGRLAKFGLEGDQPQSQANMRNKHEVHEVRVERCRKQAMNSQSGSVIGPILATRGGPMKMDEGRWPEGHALASSIDTLSAPHTNPRRQ